MAAPAIGQTDATELGDSWTNARTVVFGSTPASTDLIVIRAFMEAAANFTVPSGFTKHEYDETNKPFSACVAYKYNDTANSYQISSSVTNIMAVAGETVTGADSTTPVPTVGSWADENFATLTFLGITTAYDDALLFNNGFHANDNGTSPSGPATGWTQYYADTTGKNIGLWTKTQASAGATGDVDQDWGSEFYVIGLMFEITGPTATNVTVAGVVAAATMAALAPGLSISPTIAAAVAAMTTAAPPPTAVLDNDATIAAEAAAADAAAPAPAAVASSVIQPPAAASDANAPAPSIAASSLIAAEAAAATAAAGSPTVVVDKTVAGETAAATFAALDPTAGADVSLQPPAAAAEFAAAVPRVLAIAPEVVVAASLDARVSSAQTLLDAVDSIAKTLDARVQVDATLDSSELP